MNNCFGCEKRHVGCHAICADYAAFRQEIDAANDRKEKIKKRNALIASYNRYKSGKDYLKSGRRKNKVHYM